MTEAASFYVYLSRGRVLLIGDSLEDDEHSHHALQITIDLDDKAFALRHGEQEFTLSGAVIRPNAPHHVISSDSWRAVLLIDPQTQYTMRIQQRFTSEHNIGSLSVEDLAFCREQLRDFRAHVQLIERADAAITAVIDRLAGPVQRTETHHPKIDKALACIHNAQGKALSLQQLAAQVFLSESRLSHLFKAEIGIPIQRYLLWYKVAQTAFNIGRGMSLTTAAEESGFADSAHFSRTFRAMFGITPSQILKRSRQVRIISDAD